ncbi:MAG TPA: TIM barrel protein [Acidimicrobiales bacterium]
MTPSQFVADDVERLSRVAADAGFPSLALQSYWVTRYGVAETRKLLDEIGLTAGALEGAIRWADGPEAAALDADELLDLTATIGARVLHGTSMALELDSLPRAVEGFATLCERAKPYGIEVSVEHIPFQAIPDIATAWQIVRESGATNGGICVDLMHWHRQVGGPDFDEVRAIPGEHINYVQLSDDTGVPASSAEEYMVECLTSRPVPGDGVIDVEGMLAALAATGCDPYVAYQVCNPDMAAAGADGMAARLHANAEEILG